MKVVEHVNMPNFPMFDIAGAAFESALFSQTQCSILVSVL